MGSDAQFSVTDFRADFPLIANSEIVYLDNAATSQKPRVVIDAISTYYEKHNANVHRAAHALSDAATTAFENARTTIAGCINASDSKEVIWTRGTTEAINLVANGMSDRIDRTMNVVISEMEHHSNIVPWQLLCERTGAELRVAPVNNEGSLSVQDFSDKIDNHTAFVSLGHVSNALGTINPVREVIDLAHAHEALVLIDGAQYVAHGELDVQALGADFYAFSGHKVYGPTGIGILWGRSEALLELPVYQSGGEMIRTVSFSGTTFNDLPYKFEAGTPNIAGAVGLGAAFTYLQQQNRVAMAEHEQSLRRYMESRLDQMPRIRRIGTARDKEAVVSFLVDGCHPNDVGTLLDQQHIAVRTGHHCAMPLMEALQIPGTVRASLAGYNTTDDVDRFVTALEKTLDFL